jgi:hypothetical protein
MITPLEDSGSAFLDVELVLLQPTFAPLKLEATSLYGLIPTLLALFVMVLKLPEFELTTHNMAVTGMCIQFMWDASSLRCYPQHCSIKYQWQSHPFCWFIRYSSYSLPIWYWPYGHVNSRSKPCYIWTQPSSICKLDQPSGRQLCLRQSFH